MLAYSLIQGFYCGTEDEFDSLCKKIRQQFMTSDAQTAIFEVHEHRLPIDISSLSTQSGPAYAYISVIKYCFCTYQFSVFSSLFSALIRAAYILEVTYLFFQLIDFCLTR